MKTYIQLNIDETAKNSLRDEQSRLFNSETKNFENIEKAKEYLIERYGKMPKTNNKVYVDGSDGQAKEIGFTYSYWNKDISHNSKSWFQTDWISLYEVTKNNVLIN